MKMAQDIQLVVFAPDVSSVSVEEAFASLFGEVPASVQKNAFPQPNAPFLAKAHGERNGLACDIQVKEGRVDVSVSAIQAPRLDFQLISFDPTSVFEEILASYGAVFGAIPGVYRQAVVGNFGEPHGSASDAISAFAEGVGLREFEVNVEPADLLFTFNRRRHINDQWQINRIVRHSVDILAYFNGPQPTAPFSLINMPAVPTKQIFVHNRMLDFNTVPTGLTMDIGTQVENFKSIFNALED